MCTCTSLVSDDLAPPLPPVILLLLLLLLLLFVQYVTAD